MSLHIDSIVHTILHPKIRVYSQKIDISISKMKDSKWRIEIYEIKRFRSLKTITRGFRSWWLRKWGRKIDIFISKMVDSMSRIEIDTEHSIGIWNPEFGGFTVVKYFM